MAIHVLMTEAEPEAAPLPKQAKAKETKKGELAAFDAIDALEKKAAIVEIAAEVLRAVLVHEDVDVQARSKEKELEDSDADTQYGNALGVLRQGPEDASERMLACALAAHALLGSKDKIEAAASDAMRLAATTPYDCLPLADRASADATVFWRALADRILRFDEGNSNVTRGEAAVAIAALVRSQSKAARKQADRLTSLRDPALLALVSAEDKETLTITGHMAPAPRHIVWTILLAMTGLLVVLVVVRLIGRFVLSVRRPADVSISRRGVRIKTKTEMLGRILREREIVVEREQLVRATREVRFPSVPLYVGLIMLVIGTYFGVSILADGVRAASPTLLLTGLLITALGLGLDLLLFSLTPGTRGRCRLVFEPKRGARLCVGDVDAERATAVMAKLA